MFFCEFCEITKNIFSYRRPLMAASEPMRLLSAINTIFSYKKVFAATKIQKQPPWVFCKRRFIVRKRLQHCEVFKNTYFEKHMWAAAFKNQHLNDKFTSSRPEVFCENGVPRNFAKFTVKHLCQSLLFNEVAPETLAQVFSCEFCEISKNTFFHRTPLVAASANLPKGGNFWFFFILNVLVS